MQFPDESIMAMYLVKTHYIMRVIEFHPETQTVDLIQDVYEYSNTVAGQFCVVNEFGEEVVVSLKQLDVIYGVPVRQERFGKWSVQCCPAPGDTGYIEVFTNDILDWIENGSQSIPWSDYHFLKKSCVFVPFVPNKTNCDESYPATNDTMVIKSDKINITMNSPADSEESIKIEMTGIQLLIRADGTIRLHAPDAAVSTTCKSALITASGSATIDTPSTTITGDLSVGGKTTIGGETTINAKTTVSGDVEASGDVKAGAISLTTHTHLVTGAAALVPPPAPTPATGPAM